MKVLVTGGAGFAGSHTCEYFKSKGAKVVAYDNLTKFELKRTGYSTEAARFHNVDRLKKLGVEIAKEDIRDLETLQKFSKDVDFIVHTAAQPAMTISWEDPDLDFSTNTLGTFNVLETSRKYNIPTVSCATIHVYGNGINEEVFERMSSYTRRPLEIDEDHQTMTGQLTPLHASKMAGDLYVQSYIDTYKLPLASFRLTGIYGERQFGGEDHGWVANFAIRAVMGYPLTIFGNGKQTRDILYVGDLVKAFESFYENPTAGVYNVGGGAPTEISLIECIRLIENILGKEVEIKYDKQRDGDLIYFICDIEKVQQNLKWTPNVLPEEGVEKLVNWVKKNKKLFKISESKKS